MGEFKYRSDYERDETQKYEGTYTSEEIELNKKLFDECAKRRKNGNVKNYSFLRVLIMA